MKKINPIVLIAIVLIGGFFAFKIMSFLGAYLGGVFHDLYGSYDYAWYISIALSIFAGLIHLPIIEKQVPRIQTT